MSRLWSSAIKACRRPIEFILFCDKIDFIKVESGNFYGINVL